MPRVTPTVRAHAADVLLLAGRRGTRGSGHRFGVCCLVCCGPRAPPPRAPGPAPSAPPMTATRPARRRSASMASPQGLAPSTRTLLTIAAFVVALAGVHAAQDILAPLVL